MATKTCARCGREIYNFTVKRVFGLIVRICPSCGGVQKSEKGEYEVVESNHDFFCPLCRRTLPNHRVIKIGKNIWCPVCEMGNEFEKTSCSGCGAIVPKGIPCPNCGKVNGVPLEPAIEV